MHPRFLVTLDENLKALTVHVRVGQAVDVVGQAGRPKTITGWQTQSTPVLLAHGERAELEDEQYISLSSTLEGLVILRKVGLTDSLPFFCPVRALTPRHIHRTRRGKKTNEGRVTSVEEGFPLSSASWSAIIVDEMASPQRPVAVLKQTHNRPGRDDQLGPHRS